MQGRCREAADAHSSHQGRARRHVPTSGLRRAACIQEGLVWSHQMDLTSQLAESNPLSRHHAEEAQEQPFDRSSPNCAILGTASRVTSRMTRVLKAAMAITGGRQG